MRIWTTNQKLFLETGLRDFCKFRRFSRREVGRPDFSLISSMRLERFWSSSLKPSISSAVRLGFPFKVFTFALRLKLALWLAIRIYAPSIEQPFKELLQTLPLLDSIALTSRSRASKASVIVFDKDSKFEIADFNFFSVWSTPEFKSSFFVTKCSPPMAYVFTLSISDRLSDNIVFWDGIEATWWFS